MIGSLPRIESERIVNACDGHPYMLALIASLLKKNPDRFASCKRLYSIAQSLHRWQVYAMQLDAQRLDQITKPGGAQHARKSAE